MTSKLSKDQEHIFKEAFEWIDMADGNGIGGIPSDEIYQVLEALGHTCDDGELPNLLEGLTLLNDQVDLDAFQEIMVRKMANVKATACLLEAEKMKTAGLTKRVQELQRELLAIKERQGCPAEKAFLRDAEILNMAMEVQERVCKRLVERGDPNWPPRLLPWLQGYGLDDRGAAAVRYLGEIKGACLEDLLSHFDDDGLGVTKFLGALGIDEPTIATVKLSIDKERREVQVRELRDKQLFQQRMQAAAGEQKQLQTMATLADRQVRQFEKDSAAQNGLETKDLEMARAEARRLRKKSQRFRATVQTMGDAFVVCSAPFKDINGDDVAEALRKLQQKHKSLALAYDWPNSSATKSADANSFGKFSELKDHWQEEAIFKDLNKLITDTLWYKLYRCTIKGCLRAAALSAHGTVKAVCLEGGPFSEIEAIHMESLIKEVQVELYARGNIRVRIEVQRLPSFSDLESLLECRARVASQMDAASVTLTVSPRLTVEPLELVSSISPEGLSKIFESHSSSLSCLIESLWMFLQQRRGQLGNAKSANLVLLKMEAESLKKIMIDFQKRMECTRITDNLADSLDSSRCLATFNRSGSLPRLKGTRSP